MTPYEDPDLDPVDKEKLDAELAGANLLRMRGEYKSAIDHCLSILKRMPDNLDAHSLIGDIYSESGDLVQAAQWYELALELDPKSQPLRAKLEGVRERAQHREIAETAEQLGLPTEGPKIAIYGSALVIFIVVFVIAAFLLGQRHPVVKRAMPISLEGPGVTDQEPGGSGANDSGSSTGAAASLPPGASSFLSQDDRALTLSLVQKVPLGSHIMEAIQDPRAKVLILNFVLRADEDARKIGAELARSSFDQLPDTATITVRGTRDDKLVYIADVSREKLNEAINNADAQDGADAWIASAVTSEWAPVETAGTPPAQQPGTPSTGTATTPTGPPGSPPGSGSGAPTSGSPAQPTPKDPDTGTTGATTGAATAGGTTAGGTTGT